MNLPSSGFFYSPKETIPAQQDQEKVLEGRIEALCLECPPYGYRMVTAQLHREGLFINHKKILKIMKANDFLCRPQKKWIRTTQSDHGNPLYPNLLRNRPIMAINQASVARITYIRITACFVYLSVLLDLFSRKAIGYPVSQSLQASLTLQTLEMALSQKEPSPRPHPPV
jgi:putative transposase